MGKSGTKNLLAPMGPVRPNTKIGIINQMIFSFKGVFLLKA